MWVDSKDICNGWDGEMKRGYKGYKGYAYAEV
jgi:hypothetical protein